MGHQLKTAHLTANLASKNREFPRITHFFYYVDPPAELQCGLKDADPHYYVFSLPLCKAYMQLAYKQHAHKSNLFEGKL